LQCKALIALKENMALFFYHNLLGFNVTGVNNIT
jgi:hypothetical protein